MCSGDTRLGKKLGNKSQSVLNFGLQTVAYTLIAMVTYTSFKQECDITWPMFYEDRVPMGDN